MNFPSGRHTLNGTTTRAGRALDVMTTPLGLIRTQSFIHSCGSEPERLRNLYTKRDGIPARRPHELGNASCVYLRMNRPQGKKIGNGTGICFSTQERMMQITQRLSTKAESFMQIRKYQPSLGKARDQIAPPCMPRCGGRLGSGAWVRKINYCGPASGSILHDNILS